MSVRLVICVPACIMFALVGGCQGGDRPQTASDDNSQMPEYLRAQSRSFPNGWCDADSATNATAVGSELLNEEDSDAAQRYVPGQITAAVPAPDGGAYVLDGFNTRVVRVDSTGAEMRSWGQAGGGPGEWREGQSLAAAPHGQMAVLDGHGSVIIFDTLGAFIRIVHPSVHARHLAILPDGDMVLGQDMFPAPHGLIGAVQVDSLGRNHRVLVKLDTARIGERPLSAPLHNSVRVFAGDDGRVAVAYDTDNTIDVFRAGMLLTRIVGCVTDELLRSYREQRERNRRNAGERGTTTRIFVSAVYFDDSGDIIVSSPSADGVARVFVYDSAGALERRLAFPVRRGTPSYANTAAFRNASSLLTWGTTLANWRVRAN